MMSLINSGAFASSSLTPILLMGTYLIYQIVSKNKLKIEDIYPFILSIIAGSFVYTYTPALVLLPAFVIASILTKQNFNQRKLLLIIVTFTMAILLPATFVPIKNMLITNLTTTNPELSFFGMQGNMPGYMNPLEPLSLWFSNSNYILGTTRTGNLWILLFLAYVLYVLLSPSVYNHRIKHHQFIKYLLTLYAVLLLTTIFTRSPYQSVKVL